MKVYIVKSISCTDAYERYGILSSLEEAKKLLNNIIETNIKQQDNPANKRNGWISEYRKINDIEWHEFFRDDDFTKYVVTELDVFDKSEDCKESTIYFK